MEEKLSKTTNRRMMYKKKFQKAGSRNGLEATEVFVPSTKGELLVRKLRETIRRNGITNWLQNKIPGGWREAAIK